MADESTLPVKRDPDAALDIVRHLTDRQARGVLALIVAPEAKKRDIAIAAGYKVSELAKVSQLLNTVGGSLGALLAVNGINSSTIAQIIEEGLQSDKMATRVVDDRIEVVTEGPDHAIRLKYLALILRHSKYAVPTRYNLTFKADSPDFSSDPSMDNKTQDELELIAGRGTAVEATYIEVTDVKAG